MNLNDVEDDEENTIIPFYVPRYVARLCADIM